MPLCVLEPKTSYIFDYPGTVRKEVISNDCAETITLSPRAVRVEESIDTALFRH
jgi:hypothetical protein